MSTITTKLLAYGVRRISKDAGRKAAGKLHSDENQDDRIREIADEHGATLLDILDETNVSGSTPLDDRPYGWAIGEVEHGRAHMVIFAHGDRHDRSLLVNQQAIKRMDAAEGIVLAGTRTLSHKTVDEWFDSSLHSLLNERQLRVLAERSAEGVEKAVALGRVPYPTVPLGFELLAPNNTVRLADEPTLRIVRQAFQMRADGATIDIVRAYLAQHGHVRAYRAIQRMLRSPLYVGEIRYGGNEKKDGTTTPLYVNTRPGFPPVVDHDVWDAVQAMSVPAGRYAKSERLLARQDVVHCGGCGGRMIAGTNVSPNGRRNFFYRCGRGRTSDCPARAVIHAERLEQLVSDETRSILCDAEGRADAVREAVEMRDSADAAERKYKRARRLLVDDDTIEDDEAEQQLDELKADWQRKLGLADEFEHDCEEAELINAARDWERLSVGARRRLIKAAIRSVRVRPGRGGDVAARCTIQPKRKQSARLSA